MNMKRLVALILVLGMLISLVPLYATPDELDKLKNEKNKTNSEIKSIQNSLNQKKKEKNTLAEQLQTLDKSLNENEVKLQSVEDELMDLEQKIAVSRRELERALENATGQNELLKKRVRLMYENGNIGYLSVVLDSTSFTDFVSRLDFLKKIVDYDVKLLNDMNNFKNKIEESKDILEKEQNKKEGLKEEISLKKEEIENAKEDKNQTLDELVGDIKELEKEYDKNLREAEELTKKILALQNKNKYAGGKMQWPAPNYYTITSPYGLRNHPILKKKKMHTGIDVRVPSGSSIVAANGGKVIYAGYYGGYGYTVIIDHGGKISTLYAHNSKLLVSEGNTVKRGQKIAKSGSTGLSTGPHLHFEVRENGKHVNPMKYVKK